MKKKGEKRNKDRKGKGRAAKRMHAAKDDKVYK